MKNIDIHFNKEIRNTVKRFKENKDSLTIGELNDVKLYLQQYKEVVSLAQFFTGEVKGNKVISCITDSFYQEIFNYIDNKFKPDISIIVTPKHSSVLFKQNKSDITINLSELVKILCGEYTIEENNITISTLTKTFINFTQKLVACTPPSK